LIEERPDRLGGGLLAPMRAGFQTAETLSILSIGTPPGAEKLSSFS
jgi:hypothetical protein